MVGRAPRDHCDSWLDADPMSIYESDRNIERLEQLIEDGQDIHGHGAIAPTITRRINWDTYQNYSATSHLVGTGVIGKSKKVRRGRSLTARRARVIVFLASVVVPGALIGAMAYGIAATNRSIDSVRSISPAVARSTPPVADPFNWAPILVVGAVVLGAAALAGLAYVWRAHLGPRSRATAAAALAAKADAREAKTAWSKALVDEAGATARWLAYEKDLALAMEFPMMRDFSHPLVREVVTAMGEAAALRGGRPTVQPGREAAQQPYVAAVRRFTTALDVAQAQAERVREHLLTPEQQSNLKTARQLFRTVTDDAASVHERQVALRRMTTLLQGVLVIPEQTMSEIEHRYVRLVLASTPNAEKVPA